MKYIPLTLEQHEQLVEQMARFACAAYWRGKLEIGFTGQELEDRLKKIVSEEWDHWQSAAKAHLSMAYVVVKEQESEAC